MKFYSWILVAVLLNGFTAFSQQKTTEHIVSKGETISKIAQHYNVTIAAIYELNPEAKNGIKFKSSLLIPVLDKKNNTTTSKEFIHEVLPKESPYSISRLYGISVEELYESNPTIKETGLRSGQKINIVGGNLTQKETKKPEVPAQNKEQISDLILTSFEGQEYEVLPKQTKYSIAKEYGITVALLDKANPILQTEDLKVGQKILIPVKKFIPKKEVGKKEVSTIKNEVANEVIKISEKEEIKSNSTIVVEKELGENGIEYEVLAKQTKYNIAKEHGINVGMLDKANPVLQTEGLKVGQIIIIPVKKYIPNQEEIAADTVNVDSEDNKTEEIANADKGAIGITHEVLPKETKYAIAKEYGITVAELDKANLFLESEGLKIGQKIIVPVANKPIVAQEKISEVSNVNQVVVNTKVEDKKEELTLTHEVLAKETKYGIAKEFGVTVKELEKQNPSITKRLIIGSLLTIRGSKKESKTLEIKGEAVVETTVEESKSKHNYGLEFADQLVSTASDNIGIRYRMGGTTKDGFDCSGLMCVTYGAHDIQLPRTSLEQSRYGEVVDVDSAKKGDLIFFKTRGGSRINHVGMVVESIDGDVKFIHASNSGVIISSIKESYYAKRVVQVNRVLGTQPSNL